MTRHLLVSWAKESDTSSCPLWGLDDSHPPTSWTGILILEFYYFLLIYLVFFWKTRGSNSSSISLIIMRVLIKLQWQTEMEYTKLSQNNLAIMRGCVRWTVWYTRYTLLRPWLENCWHSLCRRDIKMFHSDYRDTDPGSRLNCANGPGQVSVSFIWPDSVLSEITCKVRPVHTELLILPI